MVWWGTGGGAAGGDDAGGDNADENIALKDDTGGVLHAIREDTAGRDTAGWDTTGGDTAGEDTTAEESTGERGHYRWGQNEGAHCSWDHTQHR